jgi:hypothetical protein
MPAQSPGPAEAGPGTQFFAIRCEIRWVPACVGMTETNYPWFKSGSYFGTDPKLRRAARDLGVLPKTTAFKSRTQGLTTKMPPALREAEYTARCS